MVETWDAEIFVIEKCDATYEVISEFVKLDIPATYLVIVENGKYVGFLDYRVLKEEMKHQRMWRSDSILVGENIFGEAREYFAEKENRRFPLPVINNEGAVLTFFVWNQQNEKSEELIVDTKKKIISLLEAGYKIELKNWDEYTAQYLDAIREAGSYEAAIRCTGRNWEICNPTQNTDADNERNIVVDNKGIHYPVTEHEVTPLFGLQEKYEWYSNRRLYVWLNDDNIFSPISELMFEYGYVIDGFCELKEKREIETLFGKSVENLEDIAQEDVLIMVQTEEEASYIERFISKDRIILFSNMFGWNTSVINGTEFQTWGSEDELKAFKKKTYFLNFNITTRNRQDENEKAGLLLWDCKLNRNTSAYKAYISTVNKDVKWYSKRKVYETSGFAAGAQKVFNFDLAIEEHKKFIIYGTESRFTNQWMHILEKFQIPYEIMEDEEIENWYGYHVSSIFDLPYYGLDNIFVIINKPYDKLEDAVELLKNYEISYENHNAISVYEHVRYQSSGENMVDMCAGPVPQALVQGEHPCYYIIGENRPEDYKIMVQGGSTSASALYTYKAWPEILQKKFEKAGKNVTIYNGAIAAGCSMQELSKVMRDARYLKPNLIISFSGVNDLGNPRMPKGYIKGPMPEARDRFSDWLFNEEMMRSVAEKCGAEFMCFAQPQQWAKAHMNKYEKAATKGFRRIGTTYDAELWRERILECEGISWMINMIDILKDEDVYIDACHVTTKGNQIIADHIYNYIADKVR